MIKWLVLPIDAFTMNVPKGMLTMQNDGCECVTGNCRWARRAGVCVQLPSHEWLFWLQGEELGWWFARSSMIVYLNDVVKSVFASRWIIPCFQSISVIVHLIFYLIISCWHAQAYIEQKSCIIIKSSVDDCSICSIVFNFNHPHGGRLIQSESSIEATRCFPCSSIWVYPCPWHGPPRL